MYVYGVPAGGKRVTFNNELSIMVPDGCVYSTNREDDQIGCIIKPESRPIGYRDGMFRLSDDAEGMWLKIKLGRDDIKPEDFASNKRNFVDGLRHKDNVFYPAVLHEDEHILAVKAYLKITLGIQLNTSSYSRSSEQGFYIYTGFAMMPGNVYTLTGGASHDHNDPWEDSVLRSARHAGYITGAAKVAGGPAIPAATKPQPGRSAAAKAAAPEPRPDPEVARRRATEKLNYHLKRHSKEAGEETWRKQVDVHARDFRKELHAALESFQASVEQEKRNAETELGNTSFFAFSRKGQLKQSIVALEQKRLNITAAIRNGDSLSAKACAIMAYFVANPGSGWVGLNLSPIRFVNDQAGRSAFTAYAGELEKIEFCKVQNKDDWRDPERYTFDSRLKFTWPEPTQQDIAMESLTMLYISMGGDRGVTSDKMREDILATFASDPDAKALPGKRHIRTKAEQEEFKESVYDALWGMGSARASELLLENYGLADASVSEVSSVLRELMLEGKVVRDGSCYRAV